MSSHWDNGGPHGCLLPLHLHAWMNQEDTENWAPLWQRGCRVFAKITNDQPSCNIQGMHGS